MKPKKRPSIYEIAEMAGVSIGTVSRVMNGKDRVHPKTRERVLAIAEKSNFRPNAAARGLATRRMSTLMLLVSDISNVYFAEMASLISREASKRGYRIVLGDSDESVERESEHLSTIEDGHVDGAIIAPVFAGTNVAHFRGVLSGSRPFVMLDTEVEGLEASCVRVDNEKGGRMAAEYLHGLGHKRIALVSGNINFQTNHLRYQGFRRGLEDIGLPISNEYLVLNQDFLQEEGFCGVEQLISLRKPPTAIFATSDLTAMACIRTILRAGKRVPEDIAVIGFDNLSISAHMEIPLTTLAQPKAEIAARAVKILVDLIESPGKKAPKGTILLDPEIVVRESA